MMNWWGVVLSLRDNLKFLFLNVCLTTKNDRVTIITEQMKKTILLALMMLPMYCFSQMDALVFFADKQNVAASIANPITILSQAAIDRKMAQGIAIDARDVPVNETYKSTIGSAAGITVLAKSKWLNAIYVRGSVANINNLLNFSFVTDVEFMDKNLNRPFQPKGVIDKFKIEEQQKVIYNYGAAQNQVEMIGVDVLHADGYDGEDILVAFMDNGYPNVLTNPAFAHLISDSRLLGYYDFVARTQNPDGSGSHGSATLSDAAAIVVHSNPNESFVGTAPKASYYLFITEDSYSETPVEEAYWVEALERADSLGVYVTNTSLGYQAYDNSAFDHSYDDLDGQTTLAARGANHGFEKGMINVTSAGNEGRSWDFGYVGTPADAPGAFTVGAVDFNENYAEFSSYGPTVDGRIKPDVMAQGSGTAIVNQSGQVDYSNGTSFSSPLIAGAIASLWQAAPHLKNDVVMQVVRESASQYNNPSYNMGYGIPNFGQALNALIQLNVEQQMQEKLFAVYPNPVNTEINISFPKNAEQAEFVLYNVLGEIVLKTRISPIKNKLDVSGLVSGMYIASITSDNRTTSFKIIKR